jgi:Cof subfamily protein (haloacid dehalogenase superfamily)
LGTNGLVERLRPGGRIDDWRGHPVRGVLLDVDGTSVGTHAEPSPAFVDACRAVQDAGLWLSFATGRPPSGIDVVRRATGSPGPFIVHNGAQVLFDEAPSQVWPLPAEALRTLERWCLDRGVYAEFAVGSGIVVTDYCEAARPSWDEVTGDPDALATDVDLATVGSCKATVMVFRPELLPELLAVCATLDVHVDPSSAPIFPGTVIVNVTAAGVNKGSSVEWLARHVDIAPEELMVVGDSENDLSMFDVAGTAVAMGQAPPRVQARAHLVTGAFDDDGCAAALRSCLERV